MKHLLTLVCLLAVSTCCHAATVTGTWELSQDISGNKSTTVIELIQEGKTLSGSIKLADKQVPVTGTITDGKVAFEYPTTWEGTPLTMIYTGVLAESGDLQGSVEVDPFGATGTFNAKRVAPKAK